MYRCILSNFTTKEGIVQHFGKKLIHCLAERYMNIIPISISLLPVWHIFPSSWVLLISIVCFNCVFSCSQLQLLSLKPTGSRQVQSTVFVCFFIFFNMWQQLKTCQCFTRIYKFFHLLFDQIKFFRFFIPSFFSLYSFLIQQFLNIWNSWFWLFVYLWLCCWLSFWSSATKRRQRTQRMVSYPSTLSSPF